jgi:hypothetical protein
MRPLRIIIATRIGQPVARATTRSSNRVPANLFTFAAAGNGTPTTARAVAAAARQAREKAFGQVVRDGIAAREQKFRACPLSTREALRVGPNLPASRPGKARANNGRTAARRFPKPAEGSACIC